MSNAQIAQELDLNKDDAHDMTTQLRQGIVTKKPASTLSGEVECDEVYIVAGHKGEPDEVVKKGALGDDGRLKGARGTGHPRHRETADLRHDRTRWGRCDSDVGERPAGDDQATDSSPRLPPGILVYTDEYDIYRPPGGMGL